MRPVRSSLGSTSTVRAAILLSIGLVALPTEGWAGHEVLYGGSLLPTGQGEGELNVDPDEPKIQPWIDAVEAHIGVGNTADDEYEIRLEEGTYYEQLEIAHLHGSESTPIVLTAKRGHKVVISAAWEPLTQPNAKWTAATEPSLAALGGVYQLISDFPVFKGISAFAADEQRLYTYSGDPVEGGQAASPSLADFAALLSSTEGPGPGIYLDGPMDGVGTLYVRLDGGADPNTVPLYIPRRSDDPADRARTLRIRKSSYVTVRGLELRHGGFSTVSIQDSTHCVVEDNTVFGGSVGIRVGSDSRLNTVRRNRVRTTYDPGWWWSDRKGGLYTIDGVLRDFAGVEDGGIAIPSALEGNVVEHNHVSGFFNGIGVGAGSGGTAGQNTNTTVRYNLIEDAGDDAIELEGFLDGEVYENYAPDAYTALAMAARWSNGVPLYVYRNRLHATLSYEEDEYNRETQQAAAPKVTKLGSLKRSQDGVYHATEDVILYNNTFVGTHHVLRSGFGSPEQDVSLPVDYQWKNNVFYSREGPLGLWTGRSADGVWLENNLYWQQCTEDRPCSEITPATSYRFWDLAYSELDPNSEHEHWNLEDAVGSSGWEPVRRESDPEFANGDPEAVNDTPLPTSPLIDSGQVLAPWPDSVSPVGAPDIGAIEVGSTISVTAIYPSAAHPNGGAWVVLTGSGFDGATTIEFDGIAMENLVFVSPSTIMGFVPPRSAGEGLVDVVATQGAAQGSIAFTYATSEWADTDEDGVSDAVDNCPLTANPGQENRNSDSVGDACTCDMNADGKFSAADLLIAFRILEDEIPLTQDLLERGDVAPAMAENGVFDLADALVISRAQKGGSQGVCMAVDP